MPTKREFLEEKTVKELKQMARDEDLTGYSNARKAELIDMINSNYTKAEIKSWSEEEELPDAESEKESFKNQDLEGKSESKLLEGKNTKKMDSLREKAQDSGDEIKVEEMGSDEFRENFKTEERTRGKLKERLEKEEPSEEGAESAEGFGGEDFSEESSLETEELAESTEVEEKSETEGFEEEFGESEGVDELGSEEEAEEGFGEELEEELGSEEGLEEELEEEFGGELDEDELGGEEEMGAESEEVGKLGGDSEASGFAEELSLGGGRTKSSASKEEFKTGEIKPKKFKEKISSGGRVKERLKGEIKEVTSAGKTAGEESELSGEEADVSEFLEEVERRGKGVSREFKKGEFGPTKEVWDDIEGIPPYEPDAHGLIPVFEGLEGYEEKGRYWVDEPYVFITILRQQETGELLYYVVEPVFSEREEAILEKIIRDLRGTLPKGEESENREEILTERVIEDLQDYDISDDPKSARKILYYARRNCIGHREIDPLMKDPNIEDISCNGVDSPIFLYHREYQDIPTNISFHDRNRLDSFVVSLAEFSGKSISYGHPTLDATLPDGSRLQATLGKEVTTHGSSFTIRKFSEEPFTPTLLIKYGTYSPELFAYLWLAMESTKNMMVIGGTASGKTSTLNALALFLPPKTKIVTLEETREITLYQENWVPNVTREATEEHETGIDLYDLVQQALRQRPECMIVGEIRGEEGLPVFQAMSTGHACYSTMHATTVQEAVNRLESEPIDVPHTMMDSLDIVCFQAIAHLEGRRVRRVNNVTEFLGLDPASGDLQIDQVFEWNQADDSIERTSESSVMREIMEDRGWDLMRLDQELEDRRMALQYLTDNNVIGHEGFSRFMAKFYANPEATLEEIRSKGY